MLHTRQSTRGMVSAPHHLAAQAGLAILREGGNAIEAAVAAAATISVVYPHMAGLGGDGFWLVAEPGGNPISIDGSGAAGANAKAELFRDKGLSTIPRTGPLAALTVAGAVSSWQAALEISNRWGGRLPLARLFEEAIHYARSGFPITPSQAGLSRRLAEDLSGLPAFAGQFLPEGEAPAAGTLMKNEALARTLGELAAKGLDEFYRGAVGRAAGADLQAAGSPLSAEDLARHRSVRRRPLSLNLHCGTAYNLPPPTQGLSSLMILGLFERLQVAEADGFAHIHGLVEATKQAFIVRNAHVTDPSYMTIHSTTYLSEPLLDRLAASIAPRRALPWTRGGDPGDTVWIGVTDAQGRAVSFIQSLCHPFGSGVLLPETGILWHNRAVAFQLDEQTQNFLRPGRKPFQTLNPAMVRLRDGRVMVYGSMGGEAQPQAQAAVFSRYVMYGQPLQQAVTAPRWALGRDWFGTGASDLKVESRIDRSVIEALRAAGHEVRVMDAFDSLMGHAGAVVWHPNGLMEGASDPRSDGTAAGY